MRELELGTAPTLHTDRLVLRDFTLADAPALFRMRSDERVMKHIGRPRAESVEDAIALINDLHQRQQQKEVISWAITLQGDDRMIGSIGYYRMKKEHFRGEVGYTLHPDHWRKGYMREALEAVVQFGFQHVGFHSVEAVTDPNNEASNALLRSCGFIREGLFKENYFWNGVFFDSAVYSRMAPTP